MAAYSALLADLRALLGTAGVLNEPDAVAKYLVDFRGLYRGRSDAVLRPASTEEVAQAVALCSAHRVPLVPHGGNTGYCGAATPAGDGSELVLSLERMNRIRNVDALNFTMTVEAGCILADVHAAAEAVGRLFPLSLGSEGSCQIGGNLATNAGGTAVLRYGNMRDLVLGLEVVLPDGRIWNGLRALRKDNMGYDLKQLFIGAEGTLGVITAAVLRLFPVPGSRLTAWLALEDLEAATELLALAREQTGDAVTTFELVPRLALELVTRHLPRLRDPLDAPHEWYALMEISWGAGAADAVVLGEALLERALEQGLIRDAAVAQSETQRLDLWRIRECIPEAQRLEGPSIKHDVSVPVQDMPRFISEAGAAVLGYLPRARLIAYGHLGDGNVHFNLSPGEGDTAEGFTDNAEGVHRIVYEIVARYGGSIAAEHGVGRLKREALRSYRGGVELELMRTLKSALDPMGLMNPGKVL